MRRIYITLILCYVIATLGYLAYIYTHSLGGYPDEARVYLLWLGNQGMSTTEEIGFFCGTLATLGSIVCALVMYRFRRYNYFFVLFVLVILISNMTIKNPILVTGMSQFISSFLAIITGALIMISFIHDKEGADNKETAEKLGQ